MPEVSGFPQRVFWLNVKLIAEELRSHVKSMQTHAQTANWLHARSIEK